MLPLLGFPENCESHLPSAAISRQKYMGSIILTSWKPQRALTPLFTWQSLGCYVTPVKLPWRMGPFNKFLKRHLIKGENIHSFFFFPQAVSKMRILLTHLSLWVLGNKASCFLGKLPFLKQTAFLEFVTLTAVCQTEKEKHCVMSFIWGI